MLNDSMPSVVAEVHFCWTWFMLSVSNKYFMLGVFLCCMTKCQVSLCWMSLYQLFCYVSSFLDSKCPFLGRWLQICECSVYAEKLNETKLISFDKRWQIIENLFCLKVLNNLILVIKSETKVILVIKTNHFVTSFDKQWQIIENLS